MSASIFDDKAVKPDNKSLYQVLGPAAGFWKDLRQTFEELYGPLIEEWKFYNQKSGWQLKLLKKKRNLFFFTPLEGFFRITFVFGDKAAAVVEESDLPENIKETLRKAKKYMEGRGLTVEVKQSEDTAHIKKLTEIKLQN